jgi:hypothetical protein
MIKAEYTQLIPQKIWDNIDTITELLKPEIVSFNIDHLLEVISIVACHIPKKRDKTDVDVTKDEAAQLQMSYVRDLVPSGDRYLFKLVESGIIKRIGSYIVGKQSFKYTFAPEYQSRYKKIPLKNIKLIKRIESIQKRRKKEVMKTIRGLCDQNKFLNMLTIDPGYKQYLKDNFKRETEKEIKSYNSFLASAIRIENKDIFFSRDKTSCRFHSNLTTMPKKLRQFLRYKGEPLVNLDLSNSQPFLSIILLTNPGKVKPLIKNPVFLMIVDSLKVSKRKDVMNFIYQTVNGKFYSFLIEEFKKEGIVFSVDYAKNRDAVKIQVLKILFSTNTMPRNKTDKKCKQIFKKCFPTVFTIFNKIRGTEHGDHFTDFRRFVILLQTIESFLILDVILKRIYRELPGLVALSVHDSIMTTENNVEAIYKIMHDEFRSYTGFEAPIKKEGIKTTQIKSVINYSINAQFEAKIKLCLTH